MRLLGGRLVGKRLLRERKGWVGVTAVALVCSCAPVDEGEQEPGEQSSELGVSSLRHPLVSARNDPGLRALGAVPFFDVQDDSAGDRLAMMEGVDVAEDGTATRFSGVFGLEQSRQPLDRRPPRLKRPDVAERMGAALMSRLETAPPNTWIEVQLSLRRSGPTLRQRLLRMLADGSVDTEDGLGPARSMLAEVRQSVVAAAQAEALRTVESLGGRVVTRYQNLHALRVAVPARNVGRLLNNPNITRVDAVEAITPESPAAIYLREGQQLDQYIDDGFNGERAGSSDVSFAHTESGAIDNDIYAYREAATGSRVRGLHTCFSSPCTEVSDYASGDIDGHSTRTASLIFGDLEDGQDPNYSTSTDRKNRSGFATEAQGYFYAGDWFAAADHMMGIGTYAPIAVNMSFGSGTDDSCLGQTAGSKTVNELFESGILTFKSAGNDGHSDTTDCTTTAPGNAIGSFTVGAYGSTSSSTTAEVRADAVCSGSARGGTSSSQGKRRSIVDLAAYAPRDKTAIGGNSYAGQGCATSYAAPAALGAAIALADHYFLTYSSVLDDPGLLHAAMLLMGDRKAETGSALTAGFSNLYGAGRMRMRRLDDVGMDAPWGFALGSVCVDDGQTITIPLNGGSTLPAAVDRVKAVAYWYDRRHEDGIEIDDMDLELRRTGVGLVVADTDDNDEKRRVFADTVLTEPYELRIIGDDVTADDAGCGTNSMLVYYAYFYEDSARDDADGPTSSEILTE
jgi:hypothetical protein